MVARVDVLPAPGGPPPTPAATTPVARQRAALHGLLPLTGLRIVLALWVVAYHQSSAEGFLGEAMDAAPTVVFLVLRTGYLAVGIFFTLSGFILAYNHTLLRRWTARELHQFAAARLARVYPAYLVALLLTVPFVLRGVQADPPRLGEELMTGALQVTMLQAWLPHTALTWNGPGWSLSVEIFLYLCFPLVGVALWRIARVATLFAVGFALWGAALVAPLAAVGMAIPLFGDLPAASLVTAECSACNLVRFNPALHLPAFAIGIVTCRLFLRLRETGSPWLTRGPWLYLPALGLEAALLTWAHAIPYPLFHNGLLLPLHATVILGFAVGGGPLARWLSTGPLVFLGGASYSVYILQAPVVTWLKLVAGWLSFEPLDGVVGMALYTALMLAVSSIVFARVEVPGNRWLKRALQPTR